MREPAATAGRPPWLRPAPCSHSAMFMSRLLKFAAARQHTPTPPRLRGEVDLRAELLRSEASRVRGRFHRLSLAEAPPHPDSFAPLRFARNPTSPARRG